MRNVCNYQNSNSALNVHWNNDKVLYCKMTYQKNLCVFEKLHFFQYWKLANDHRPIKDQNFADVSVTVLNIGNSQLIIYSRKFMQIQESEIIIFKNIPGISLQKKHFAC